MEGGRPGDAAPDDFEQIVAAWRAEGTVPHWPGAAPPDPPTGGRPDGAPGDPAEGRPHGRPDRPAGTIPPGPGGPADHAPARPAPDVTPPEQGGPDPDEEHFVPPEPPPLPRIGPAVGVGLVLVLLGIVLAIAPSLVGVPSPYGLPLGLVVIAGGLTWLLMRLWEPDSAQRDPDDPSSPDDGAVV